MTRFPSGIRFFLAATLAAGSVACGGESDTTTHASAGDPGASVSTGTGAGAAGGGGGGGGEGGFHPAAHLPLPSIPDQGGAKLPHVKLVTITFAGYAYEKEVQAFGDWIVGSKWLETVGSEYGIGAGTHTAKIVVPESPPAAVGMAEIEAFLESGIESGLLPAPSPDDDSMYVVYYPESTQVNAPGFQGCQTGGYHAFIDTGPVRFAYSPIPDCSVTAPASWSAIESIEENASHEIIEALTDPYFDEPGFYLNDPDDPWSVFYGEVADLCVGGLTHEGDFAATTSWSNAAAKTGMHPCQPAPDAPYFNVSPGTAAPVTVPAGGTATFTITGFSSGPRAPWAIFAGPGWNTLFDPSPASSATSIENGEEVTITVSAPAGKLPGTRGSVIVYSLERPTVAAAMWPILLEVE